MSSVSFNVSIDEIAVKSVERALSDYAIKNDLNYDTEKALWSVVKQLRAVEIDWDIKFIAEVASGFNGGIRYTNINLDDKDIFKNHVRTDLEDKLRKLLVEFDPTDHSEINELLLSVLTQFSNYEKELRSAGYHEDFHKDNFMKVKSQLVDSIAEIQKFITNHCC